MKNPIYEQALKDQGVAFTYLEKVPLVEIDIAKGLKNQARLEKPLDEDVVRQYQIAYEAGADFPPLVLAQLSKTARYLPLDGNQRLAAAKAAGRKHHDAYVVESADQMVLDRIAWSFNNHVNGLRLTPDECLEHAVSFVRKYGASQESAAKEWGISLWKIQRRVRNDTIREKLAAAKVKNAERINDDTLIKLSPLLDVGDDILVEAGRVVADSGATATQAEDLTQKIRSAKTHAAKVAEIGAFESSEAVQCRRAETRGGTIKRQSPAPRERFDRALSQALKVLEDFPDRKALLPASRAEQKRLRGVMVDLVRRLMTMFGIATELQTEEAV